MTNLLGKIVIWLRNAFISFVVIFIIITIPDLFSESSQSDIAIKAKPIINMALESAKKKRDETRVFCTGKKEKIDDLIQNHPVASKNPVHQIYLEIKTLEQVVAGCDKLLNAYQKEYDDLIYINQTESNQVNSEDSSKNLINLIVKNISSAFFILIFMLITAPLVKIFYYYVLAPIATTRPPLVIVSDANGGESSSLMFNRSSPIGAVSQSVSLTPNQVLLVHSDYLQTTPLHAKKSTKWFLNNSIPFSSLSSGMYMLTCVACDTSDPIVVSSTNDHFSEVGIVELPDGAAFVCQPRSLVGVVYERGRPIRVTKHWHLWSLQSWLTFQFRFIVFHGPGRLLLKGTRGIRMETASAARLLNQNATLGFSANLNYSNTRSETFIPYWAGKESLFHDLFLGSPGVYVYEEVPAAKPSGVTAMFERIVNSVLNAFGI